MREAIFTFACGRKVFMEKLDMKYTYHGLIDGSFESSSRSMRRNMHRHIHTLFRFNTHEPLPLVVHDDGQSEFPKHHWLAYFYSGRPTILPEDNDPRPGYPIQSELYVTWFTDELPSVSLHLFVQKQLIGIRWDEHAEDFEYNP